jgi:hypothetical protein
VALRLPCSQATGGQAPLASPRQVRFRFWGPATAGQFRSPQVPRSAAVPLAPSRLDSLPRALPPPPGAPRPLGGLLFSSPTSVTPPLFGKWDIALVADQDGSCRREPVGSERARSGAERPDPRDPGVPPTPQSFRGAGALDVDRRILTPVSHPCRRTATTHRGRRNGTSHVGRPARAGSAFGTFPAVDE